jgi:hypothetical protein
MITERERKLWDLLDDIDSASDIFRPKMDDPFVSFVMEKVQARHQHLVSDGYNLFEPETLVENPRGH